MCKIALLENYALFSSGIKPILKEIDAFQVVVEAKDIEELLPLLKPIKPDVIIIDIIHCENEGLMPIRKIKRVSKKIPILLILSEDYAGYIEKYITLGINGIVFNTSKPSVLIKAVKKLNRGEEYFRENVWMIFKRFLRNKKNDLDLNGNNKLTSRELAVLKHFCKGETYKEIGNNLNISPRTVETHKRNILSKLEIRSTAEMVEYAIHHKLIH